MDRLNDWQFRFYACKNSLANAAIILRLMEKYEISEEKGITKLKNLLAPELPKKIMEYEKDYQFSDGELLFVSDMSFAIVLGMLNGGFELSDLRILQIGNGLCISTIEKLSN